jgi:transcriptional regulator with GAF, ATPase, and Fis domain
MLGAVSWRPDQTAHPMSDDGSELEQVLAIERMLANLSAGLIGLSPEEIDRAVPRGLAELADVLDVDRTTLMELAPDGQLTPIYSWARPGVPPEDLPVTRDRLPWYYDRLLQGQPVVLQRLPDDLPVEAAAEREYVRQRGIKSHLGMLLAVGGRPLCLLGVAAFRAPRPWPPDLIPRLRLAGEIFANALHRKRSDLTLQAQLAEITALKTQLEAENVYLREEASQARGFDEIVGDSPLVRQALQRTALVAPTNTAVLIRGETGTGKELIARAIHRLSPRRDAPLVVVNCAALPASLIEAELFGHDKGAFTGATAARAGRFEVAHGGTLFLDEIGELGVELQAKLLRVLETGEFQRVGSSQTRTADVRLIAATNRNLEHAMAIGRFREDLYYRLNVFPILLPPLRDRPEDIPKLVWALVTRRQGAFGKAVTRIPRVVMAVLQAYAWPGNVRELENVVERALILTAGSTLRLDASFRPAEAKTVTLPSGGSPRLAAVERAHILQVLAECRWRINGAGNAAERLGLHPNTLRFRMKKLGITRPPPRRGHDGPAAARP